MEISKWVVASLAVCIFGWSANVFAVDGSILCESVEKKPIKVEVWISKKFKKQRKVIKKELGDMGNTKVRLKVFPMKDPAKVVGIGKCVPAYIGRHMLQSALKYSGGVGMLVDQDLLSHYWVGLGTMAFDEHSQRAVSETQVKTLLDESLDTAAFQKLIGQYSNPKAKMNVFGRDLPNSRRSEITPAWEGADAKNK